MKLIFHHWNVEGIRNFSKCISEILFLPLINQKKFAGKLLLHERKDSKLNTSWTSSTIRVVETEGQFNTEGQKVLASRSDRHGTIADMDTCSAIDMTIEPEDCDGLTQQVVDWNKRCCGAKSGHLGQLFESQNVSETRIKELANIEKLEVAEITLQEARAQATEIVYARCLDDVARRTPERSCCRQKQ